MAVDIYLFCGLLSVVWCAGFLFLCGSCDCVVLLDELSVVVVVVVCCCCCCAGAERGTKHDNRTRGKKNEITRDSFLQMLLLLLLRLLLLAVVGVVRPLARF